MPPGERVDDVFHCPAFDPNKKGEKRCEYPHQKKGNTRLTGHQTNTNLNKMSFSCSVFIDSATQPHPHTPILYHFALFTYIAN